MMRKLDLNGWSRINHFNFFKEFEEPFFGVSCHVDVTKAYKKCKRENTSFFIYYLHCALKTANSIEAFKYRIKDNDVLVYDVINASSTINRPDGSFGFSYIDYDADFTIFKKKAEKIIANVKSETTLVTSAEANNTIHFSALPWIKFTSVSHARSFKFKESIPKISFGKIFQENETRLMPISIHVHHALMDGYHVGVFVEEFQNILNE